MSKSKTHILLQYYHFYISSILIHCWLQLEHSPPDCQCSQLSASLAVAAEAQLNVSKYIYVQITSEDVM